MKFPKLRWLPTILFFFLSGIPYLYGQVLSPPTLTSTHGSGPIISVCTSDTVTFTAAGDIGPTANNAEFKIIRAGVTSYPLGASGPQAILSFSSSNLQNGDQVVATVWTYDYGPSGGVSALTNTITIALGGYPEPVAFTSDTAGNTVCNNQTVQLSASTVSTLTMFEFFVDGISIQGPSLVSTLSHVFSTTSTATLIASVGGCSRSFELPIQLIDLTPGTITGGGEVCFADVPTTITSLVTGTKDGVELSTSTVTTFYQWQSSLDGVVWNNILGAQSIDYTPPSLNQTTHFRRKLVATAGGKTCEAFSNQITIKVIPLIEAGYIEQSDQFFCSGDAIPTLTVTQSTIAPGILYQWQQSVDDGISYSNISLAVASDYTPAGLTQTTLFRRATFINSGSGCVSTTLPVEFVLLDINPGSLDVSQNRTICHGTAPPVLSNGATGAEAISVTGTTTYQWQQSLDNTNWSNIPLASSSSYAPPALTVSTYFRRAAITTSGSAQCSDTTNTLLISVYDEINAGTLLGDQILCENDLPTALSLSGTTSATGTSYQWQMSTDNVNFTTLTNSQPTLSFTTTTTAWNPTVTSYYRVLVRNFVSPGCVATSTTAEIIVNPAAQIIQTSGPGPQQEVCPGDAIINATFTLTGSATTLTAVGAGGGTGLSFTGPVGGVYTLSGTPTSDAVITITANAISPCNDVTYQYNIFQTTPALTPSYIRKGVDTAEQTVFQRGGLWYNNTLNQNPASSSITNFYACQNTTAVSVITHEWMVSPATAGSIDPSTGVMTWNPTFSGTAIVSVRSISCGGNSAWLDNSIEVIPSTIPATTATSLTEPMAFDLLFCDTETGAAPSCEITASTPNTRFFSTTAGGTSDYQSIQWSIENVVPGGGLTGVTDPGTIDSATGEVNWNTGFYGSVDIQAQAINFDGSLGVVRSTTVQIGQMTDIAPNIITVSPSLIPSCPPQGSYQTDFRSNREVTWSLSNSNAGSISSTATNTARMTWADDFSGTVRIIATASGVCESGESELIAIIPGAASIQTLTGLDDVQLCEGENLVGIPYDIGGFPSSASVSGLPSGITGTLSATFHIVDIVYSGTSSANETYQLEILGQLYTYTTTGVETADQVVQGLANVVSASPTRIFDATHTGPNTLRLQPKVAGVSLSGTVFFGSVTVTIIPVSRAQREFILSGVTTASPGEYVYTITTEGGEGFCQQASIQGKITVVGTSSLTLEVGSDDNQVVCDTAALAPIEYAANYASFVIVDGLPAGVSYVASSTGVIISGTPTVNVTQTTVYTYTVSTTNNIYGCSPEASITGQITVEPLHIIELSSALGTDNQTICNSGGVATLTPIEYTLDGGAIGSPPVVMGLPPGLNNVYNPTNKTLLISGAPNITVTTTTVYTYTVTTVGANCMPVVRSGTITVNPNPTISLTSAVGTDDQTGLTALCMGMAITPIQYTLEHTNSIVSPIIGLPNGLTVTQSASVVTISGIPDEAIATNQIYTYTISTDGSTCQPEATVTGQIELYPLHEISLTSLAGTDNQEICNSGGVATLTPIEYTLGGGATDPPVVLGLPLGITADFDSVSRTITISGSPTTMVATQTIYNYTVTTAGTRCASITLSGSITVNPSPSIRLTSAAGTDDQTGLNALCFGMAITPIQYTLENASSFVNPLPGLPNGLVVSQSGNVVTISGTPDVSITTNQIYTYTISTDGSYCQPETSVTGQIEVYPLHEISLTSLAGTDNQEICNSGGVAPLTPIEYTMAGGATDPPIVLGLPAGISSNFDSVNRTVTISGTPTTKVAVQTIYNYTVTTVGARCASITLSGSITVNPSPSITLSSAVGTDDQTGTSAICLGTAITPIQYTLVNASSFVDPIPGLPNGLIVSQSGNVVTISGTPDVSINFTQIYNYTITTMGSGCQPEASVTGQIEVIPNPQFDENYINVNDVSHVSCPGSSDGAIRIPEEGSLLDLRIQGGQSPVAQVEEVILSNQPALGDVYTLTINGIVYTHTVIASGFGGPVQTLAEVTTELVDLINNAIGTSESVVTASYSPVSTIRLVADTPGMAFSIATNVSTTLTGAASPVITTNHITANLSTNYAYLWTGPSGFSSSDLQIENLAAGDYTLRVSVGICSFSEATFTINEPTPITAINEVCGGSFKTTLSGGTGPYTLMLHDELGNLLRTDTTNSIYIYSGLTPGANYRLDVVDSNCAIPSQFAISLPFELQYNPANVVLIHDYCQQVPNTGEGSIVLGTVVGNAFSGGSGNFSYRWSGPTGNLITRDIQNLVAGDYTVTVTDNELGCSRSETFSIASNSPLNLTLAGSSVLNADGEIELPCADDTSGEIQVNVTGGFGVYTYTWEKDGVAIANNTNRLQNISPGQYSVTVTDVPSAGISLSNLCQLTEEFTVVAPPLLTLSVDQNSITQPNCSGETVRIPVEVSGGTPPYTISLNGAMTVSTSSPTYVFENIIPTALGQTVTVTVEDQNGCAASPLGVSINVPTQYVFEGSTASIDCRTNTLGEIQLVATPAVLANEVLLLEWRGDTVHFFDTWSNGQGRLGQLTNPGTYTVSISSQQGCVLYSESFVVEDLTGDQLRVEVAAEISSTSCNEDNGRIDLDVTNGFPPYTIQWERLSATNSWTILNDLSNQAIVTELSAGTYRAIVSDSSLATSTDSCLSEITTRNIVLTDQRFYFTNLSIGNPLDVCNQNGSGSVLFGFENTLTSNGVDDPVEFSYFIDDVQIPNDSDRLTFNSTAGIYQITEIDAGIHTLKITADTVSSSCSIEEAFTIDETLSPYQFSGDLSYTIEGCNSFATIQLETTPTVVATEVLLLEWRGDTIHFFDTWSNGQGKLSQLTNPGTYTVSITNQQGCVLYSSNFLVEEFRPDQLTVDILQEASSTTCNQDQGRIDLGISNGFPPYTIQWERMTATNSWTILDDLANQAIVDGLPGGTYRAIVADSSPVTSTTDCQSEITTRNIVLTDQRIAITSIRSVDSSNVCMQNGLGTILVELDNGLTDDANNPIQLSFFIDGEEISANSDRIVFDSTAGVYEINDIAIGDHTLSISASSGSFNCSVEEMFTLDETINPILFTGQLAYDIDVCSSYASIQVDSSEITGGNPFAGGTPYDLKWIYIPLTSSNAVTQTFFGSSISNAAPGTYELVITDSNGCQNNQADPILIEVIAPDFDPFAINGILADPNGEAGELVKVIPIVCGSDVGGQIGVEVTGGLRPFEINWYLKDPNQITNTSTNQGFELLPQYANQAVLSGLDAGVYKIEVRSLNNNCSGAESIYTFVSEIIEVLPNPDLFIVSGPFVDADLCGGNPGRLSIEVFDNNQGELFFYYEGEQIQEEDNPQVNEQTHTLLIHTPVENGTLRIVNEQGCFITKELNLQLGEPNFSFTSASFETTNVILAREEIQFENTSTDPYIRSEWLFGDFDSPLVVPNVASSTFVRHSYPVSGAYNVTLRIFNSTGCFKEITQTVSVGRGYSILLPNVFSPNNDSINDVFRPITTGLSKVTFSVYDNLGNLIYTESVAELDLDNIQGVEIGGWDGQDAPSVPFFIYTIEALLLDGVTKVEDTGTFILLR